MTDTERLDWIERNAVTVHVVWDDKWNRLAFAVHSNDAGWQPSKVGLRDAIDATIKQMGKAKP